ncbi:hypothetical protein L484_024775 [Morus notabilis]|uniref:Uncharacterized protein n=1 Tax=Morus notabilis TaxID=981085 RepID=W9QWC3_9ROSA|nr:hypothetical protein L484_024775 [Morus notabilis]
MFFRIFYANRIEAATPVTVRIEVRDVKGLPVAGDNNIIFRIAFRQNTNSVKSVRRNSEPLQVSLPSMDCQTSTF